MTDFQKEMLKFAYYCTINGIDIEQELGSKWGTNKEQFLKTVQALYKNFGYLHSCVWGSGSKDKVLENAGTIGEVENTETSED